MRKLIAYFISLCVLLCFIPGCNENSTVPTSLDNKDFAIKSEKEAKEALIEFSPEALIINCKFIEETKTYEIEYTILNSPYIASVNAVTGSISSSYNDKDSIKDPTSFADEGYKPELIAYSIDSAFSLAVTDAIATENETTNTAIQIQQDYMEENKSYFVAFLLLDCEYQYIINASTGDILQMVKIDSETGEILTFRKTIEETNEVICYTKTFSETGEATETLKTYSDIIEFYQTVVGSNTLPDVESAAEVTGEETVTPTESASNS